MKSSYVRTLAVVVFAALIPSVPIFAGQTEKGKNPVPDKDGHSLVRLWKELERMAEDDRPDADREILLDIISAADRKKLAWDFYDAWLRYRSAELAVDRHKRSEADSSIVRAVRRFGEPVALFTLSLDGIIPFREDFAGKNRDKLEKARNSGFYGRLRGYWHGPLSTGLPDAVINSIYDDYEYVLWASFLTSGGKTVEEPLREALAGNPLGLAYIELYTASAGSNREKEMEAFVREHGNEPVSLYARELLLLERFSKMQAEDASSEDYMELRKSCDEFETLRRKFGGDVADDCTGIERLIKTLDGKDIHVFGTDDSLFVRLRNTGEFRLLVQKQSSGETVLDREIVNGQGSYFRYDTLAVGLPAMDDGIFDVRCITADDETETVYRRASLAAAYRGGDKSLELYVADRKSGKPVRRFDVEFFQGDSLIGRVDNVAADGFTSVDLPAPDAVGKGYILVCSYEEDGFLKKTEEIYMRGYVPDGDDIQEGNGVMCHILKDRSVFGKGDTLSFKALLYRRSESDTGLETVPESTGMTAYLKNADGVKLDSLSLSSDDFGSASGIFRIPENLRAGMFCLEVVSGGRTVGKEFLTVGEFTLPSFSLEFDPSDRMYFPGDSICISGLLRDYASRGMAGWRIDWTADHAGGDVQSGRIMPDPDGRFSFSFATPFLEYSWFDVRVRVTSPSGETDEFSEQRTVAPYFSMSAGLENASKGILTPGNGKMQRHYGMMQDYGCGLLDSGEAVIGFDVRSSGYESVPGVPVSYSVYRGGRLVHKGTAESGCPVKLETGTPGLYRIEASASMSMRLEEGRDSVLRFVYVYDILRAGEDGLTEDADFENMFRVPDGDDIALQVGTGNGPVWGVAELWGADGSSPLRSEPFFVDGTPGKMSFNTLRYDFGEDLPDEVRLSLLYFRNGRDYRYSEEFRRKNRDTDINQDADIALKFTSFTDSAEPYSEVSVSLETSPFAECAVSVFDKGTESLMPNVWSPVHRDFFVPHPVIRTNGGWASCYDAPYLSDNDFLMKSVSGSLESRRVAGTGTVRTAPDALRNADSFRNTLAFLPSLRPDGAGTVSFSFRASGKISEYNVAVFAHDREMRSAVIRREIKVRKPVAVSASVPQYLREGDRYCLKASLSNISGKMVSGIASLYVYDGKDYRSLTPLLVCERPVFTEAGAGASVIFPIDVPQGTDTLGFRIMFDSAPEVSDPAFSDGIFVAVPVFPDEQILTEAHSCVILPGADRDSLVRVLAGRFENVSGIGAVSREISLLDMIMEELPVNAALSGSDAVSVSDALYVRILSGGEPGTPAIDTLTARLDACRNSDGGFGWFAGMKSNPQVTALVLERIAGMRKCIGKDVLDSMTVASALRYFDSIVFDDPDNMWREFTPSRYLYLRTMFPSVEIGFPESDKALRKSFLKDIETYLETPTGDPGFDSMIADKARRISSVLNLLSEEASDFAVSMGYSRRKLRRFMRTAEKDAASICSYAVPHSSGGMYFPSMTAPSAGFFENELYSHTLVCNVLRRYSRNYAGGASSSDPACNADRIADGTSLWIMVQKENLRWKSCPASSYAVSSVLNASDEVLGAKIMVLSKKYVRPFSSLKPAGNGFSIEREYHVLRPGSTSLIPLATGDTVSVGDKIVCRYKVNSDERRSFVRIAVPRPASFVPAEQLSGVSYLTAGSVGRRYGVSFYRNVGKDRTEFFFNEVPSGEFTVSEDFFVSRSGRFSSGVLEVESLYADHYRGNSGFEHPVICHDPDSGK